MVLILLFFIAALLYSSVGHAGASGYLAAMALMAMSPEVMKPTALMLNIVVASIASTQFYRAGAFSWRLFWPLAMSSIPCAYLGGSITLPDMIYKPIIGGILIYSAFRSLYLAQYQADYILKPVKIPILLLAGATLGFFSGLSGVGGGIFLSPLLLLCQWQTVRVISGISALFILVNSTAGLLGFISKQSITALPADLPWWIIAVIIAGYIGSEYGSKRLKSAAIERLLAIVLVVAGLKMLLSSLL